MKNKLYSIDSTKKKAKINSPVVSSEPSEVTVTTTGSLQSIPSSISQTSPMGYSGETILSHSSSSGRHSISEEISTRLSGKRLSIEQVSYTQG